MPEPAQQPKRSWPILRSLSGWRRQNLPGDLSAGLTLAAIAVPEQMATARLGSFPPELGLIAFVAGTLAFALFGSNRYLSSGTDSTIMPIFAGALGLVAMQGSPAYGALAAALALSVGAAVVLCGVARLGWIANFLSVPVTTGFLAGIAVHIVASQLPGFLGLEGAPADLFARLDFLVRHLVHANLYALLLGALVLGTAGASEALRSRVPGALVGLALATLLVALFGLESKGVAVVGTSSTAWPRLAMPSVPKSDLHDLGALTLIVATIVMVQTAATTRAFASLADPQDVNRDLIGVGAGSMLAGLFGLFPVNASPPRTAAVEQAGGHSQIAGLAAAGLVVLLIAFGAPLLRNVPLAALAGILLAVALRIARFSAIAKVLRQSPAEFGLIIATTAAIVVLPIQLGVALGISLSVLHGIWTITRSRMIELERVPGTSVWWPPTEGLKGERMPHVRVVGFQAPLSFLNADEFRRGMIEAIESGQATLIVFEASGVAEIDFTAAQVLLEIIERCREAKIAFAIARLTSLRAQSALRHFGLIETLGPRGFFRSVEDAVDALAPVQRS